MTDNVLERKLRSIGMTAFVENFDLFAAMPAVGRPVACMEELVRRGWSNPGGAHWRAYAARSIFRATREHDALNLVLGAGVHDEVREKARLLLMGLG